MECCPLTQLVVFDDEAAKGAEWAERLQVLVPNWDVVCRKTGELEVDLAELEARRQHAIRGEQHEQAATVFDSADVLVVDFNLFQLDRSSIVSGEDVAYLARCFSTCGFIVGVNQDATARWYDLDMVGHPDAFTDLSVGADHLFSPELWVPSASRGAFSPWHWSCVPTAAAALNQCFELTRADQKVFDLLNFAPERVNLLPRDVLSRVQLPNCATAVSDVTIEEVVRRSPLGLRLNESPDPDQIARIGAARLRKWLNGEVVAREDLLVDPPHLLRRLPGLAANPASWAAPYSPDGTSPALNAVAGLEEYAQASGSWLDRPVWWWPPLASSALGDRLRDSDDATQSSLVFCEDSSRFVERSLARPFVSRVGGPFSQRWVEIPRAEEKRLADYEPGLALAR